MIPKKIHYIWIGENEKSQLIKNCIESWEKYCPDYEIIEWNESNLDINKYQYAKDAYNNRKWAFFSDVFRFDILNEYGGIYLDTDVELYSSLDEFLQYDFFTGFENKQFVNPGLIMGCIPNNEICNNILKIYSSLQFDINNLITVCQVTTDYLKQNYNLQINNKTQKLDNNIKIYSTEYFCPKDYKSGKIKVSPNTVSIHHYNASWVTKESLFTKFKRLIKQIVKFIIGKKNYEKLKKKYKHDKN